MTVTRRPDRAGAKERRWGRTGASGCDSARSAGTWSSRSPRQTRGAGSPGSRSTERRSISSLAGPRAHWSCVDQGDLRGGHPTARPVAAAVADGRDGGQGRAGARTPAAQDTGRGGPRHDAGDVMTPLSRFPISARAAASDLERARRGTRNGSDSSLNTRTRVASGIDSPARLGCTCTPRRQQGPPRTRSRAGRSRTSSR